MACRFLLWLCRISAGFTRCLVVRHVSQVWSYWLPMLMFIQEGPLLPSRRRAPASCENTIKEALVLISRILKVYLLKKKSEINGLCLGFSVLFVHGLWLPSVSTGARDSPLCASVQWNSIAKFQEHWLFIFSAFLFLERCVLGLPFGQWKLHIHFRVIVIWNEAVKQGDWEVRGRTRNRPGEPQQVWEQSVCVYANWELHTCTVNGRNC